jgi:predicted O-methyltransferase YrrM
VSVVRDLGSRIDPDGAVTRAGHRAVMLAAHVRARGRDDPPSRAIARATLTAATGRHPAAEREWIDRIEDRRRRIPADAPGDELRGACPFWSIPRHWGRFLTRLVVELAPENAVEMGVGFGMSGCYQAAALEVQGRGRLTCLDQEESLAEIARESFAELGLDHRIELHMGPIGQTLGPVAERVAPIDYAYIDAEHTEAATVHNFEVILPHLTPGAVVVVDDVMLGDEMTRAWDRIAGHRRVAFALSLRRLGLVVVNGG